MKKLLSTLFASLLLLFIAIPVQLAYAETSEEAVCGSVEFISGESCDPAAGDDRVNNLLDLGINIFAIVLGIIAVFIVIIAGLTIATSGGDSAKISKARETIIYASVGIVVIVFARLIVRFIIDKVG